MNEKKKAFMPEKLQTTETADIEGQCLTFAVDDYDSSVTLSKTEGGSDLGEVLLYEDQIKAVIEKLTAALKRFEAFK